MNFKSKKVAHHQEFIHSTLPFSSFFKLDLLEKINFVFAVILLF